MKAKDLKWTCSNQTELPIEYKNRHPAPTTGIGFLKHGILWDQDETQQVRTTVTGNTNKIIANFYFGVLKAVNVMGALIGVLMFCSWERNETTKLAAASVLSCLIFFSSLKIEGICPSETLGSLLTTRHYNQGRLSFVRHEIYIYIYIYIHT
jgi:hypothetical protein